MVNNFVLTKQQGVWDLLLSHNTQLEFEIFPMNLDHISTFLKQLHLHDQSKEIRWCFIFLFKINYPITARTML